ncbi:hypothetical protein FQA39_LY09605 [Lamprigera yunnana]|nr:hypothetical protein FQA39_LY09605 [Lamprigera yunnana]
MKAITVVLIFGLFSGALGSCQYVLDKAGEECAKPYGFTSPQVFDFFFRGYTSKEAPSVNLFVECLWKKWGFLNDNGVINYRNIKKTNISAFQITGECLDVFHGPPGNAFNDAVEDCRMNAPADIRAETIRSCITTRYREFLKH